MLKIIITMFFLPALFLSFASDSPKDISDYSPTPTPTRFPEVINEPANVENVILDQETVNLWCPTAISKFAKCSKEGMKVNVKTKAKDKEDDLLVYDYKVSGGRIIGRGKEVIWDLFGERPGKYTITVGVDDGCGICGETVTKTIEIEECNVCEAPPCECPTIKVSSSKKTVYKGEIVEFNAIINGGTQDEITYNWTIKNGVIFEGQGTSIIKIQALTGESVTATVEIGGLCETCIQTDSDTIKIIK